MTIAIVKDGVFQHTAPEINVRDSQGVMRKRCVDKAEGWYEFIPAKDESGEVLAQEATEFSPAIEYQPKTQKAQGTIFTVDNEVGTVTESYLYVDLTQEELNKISNEKVLKQIAEKELVITNRRIREAALTVEGKDWLTQKDAEITALRATLIAE